MYCFGCGEMLACKECWVRGGERERERDRESVCESERE